jgi:hypothetical protein
MKSRSLLLYVPGIPLLMESLLPQRPLAALAASLLDAGHETRILDYGTLSAMERFLGPGRSEGASAGCSGGGWLSRLRTPWRTAGFQNRLHRFYQEVLQGVTADPDLDFVVFLVNTRDDLRDATQVALRLRELRPGLRRLAAGSYIERCAPLVLAASNAFDAAMVEDPERILPLLADLIHRPEQWPGTPALHYRLGGELLATGRAQPAPIESLPLPRYDASLYPAVHHPGKLRLFCVEHSRGGLEGQVDRSAWRVRMKPSATLRREIAGLLDQFPASVFHLEGPETSGLPMAHFAGEIRSRGLRILYSREGHIRHADPATLREIAHSGCEAIDFQVDTGSQRLLEDFYRHPFSVSEIERALHGCRAANLFTTLRLTFPCPWDDYHTRAETVRLLERCRPQGVSLSPPWLWPGSLWRQRAPEYGYHLNHTRYLQWMAATNPADRGAGRNGALASYRMLGWSAAGIDLERRALSTEIEALGIGWHATSWEGLMARVAGYRGREEVYCGDLRQALAEGSFERAVSLIEIFNSRVAACTNVDRIPLYVPLPAAVGN